MIFNQKAATQFLNNEYDSNLKDYFLTADRQRGLLTSCGTKGKAVLYDEDELRRYANIQGYTKRGATPYPIKIYSGKNCLLWGNQLSYIKKHPSEHNEIVATDKAGNEVQRWSYKEVYRKIMNNEFEEKRTYASGKT
ncbi:MAG: hypothetical protein WC517_04960, partial [Patescibacteria group bacterium]